VRTKPRLFDLTNNTILILIALVCVYPFLYILATSLSDGKEVVSGHVVLFPKGLNIEAYLYILGNPRLGVSSGLLNSFFYTIVGGAVAVTVTFMTAYPLSRKRLIGRYVIMLVFLFTWVFEAGLIPNYIIYNALGLVNSRLVMILPMAVNTFLLIITKSFLDALPYELEEAAVIDGANDWQIMWKVFFPLSKPIIATISVFNAVFIWNQFLIPMIYLQDRGLQPITVVLYNMIINSGKGGTALENITVNGVQLLPQNLQAASIFLAIVPILFIYPFTQRFFTQGMLLGSVKG
jgi:putative aldouronate transport system permease protein